MPIEPLESELELEDAVAIEELMPMTSPAVEGRPPELPG